MSCAAQDKDTTPGLARVTARVLVHFVALGVLEVEDDHHLLAWFQTL